MKNPEKSSWKMDNKLKLDDFLPYRLSVLSNTVSGSIARLYAEQFDLTIPEWRIMAVLGSDGPLTANDVTERTAMDKVQVSRAVSRLVQKGHLTRNVDPQDRRRATLDFSDAGRAVYDSIVPLARGREETLLKDFSDEEIAILDLLLKKLQTRADGLR